jgi:FtsZ-binding cell division protein ZapB
MSKFTETRTPYEFLVRWNQDNTISGAHVGFLETVLKDGEVLTQKQNNVESVAMGLQEGFPLLDILDQVLIDALLLIETVKSENATLQNEVQKTKAEAENLNIENATVKAEIETLKAKIEALKIIPNEAEVI